QATAQATQFIAAKSQVQTAATQIIAQNTQALLAEAQAQTQAAQATAQSVAAIQQALPSPQAYHQAASQSATQTQGWGDMMKQVWAVVAGLGIATTIGGIVSQLKEWVVESVNVAVKMESLQTAFKFLSGGAQQGASTFAFLRETANKLGVDFVTLAE